MLFSELGLSAKVLKAIEASGYTVPTPIQAQSIPHALEGRDILCIAQTGTGKTAAFTLPMLSMLEKGRARARMPRTLILEPTRELAAQVEEAFGKYGVNHKLNVALLIGGVSFADQDAKIAEIKERYGDGEISELDGVSVDYEDWHFNVRPSNTEPLLRLNLESLVSREDMESRRDELLELIRSS